MRQSRIAAVFTLLVCCQIAAVAAIGGIDNCNAAGEDINKKKVCYECATGYYISADKSLCPACLNGCSACKDGSSCESCNSGFFINTTSKVCDSCGSGCSACQSGAQCTTCTSDYSLKDGACVKNPTTTPQTSSTMTYVIIGVVLAGVAAGIIYFVLSKNAAAAQSGQYTGSEHAKNSDNAPTDIIDARL